MTGGIGALQGAFDVGGNEERIAGRADHRGAAFARAAESQGGPGEFKHHVVRHQGDAFHRAQKFGAGNIGDDVLLGPHLVVIGISAPDEFGRERDGHATSIETELGQVGGGGGEIQALRLVGI
jgi:hypothetical protein